MCVCVFVFTRDIRVFLSFPHLPSFVVCLCVFMFTRDARAFCSVCVRACMLVCECVFILTRLLFGRAALNHMLDRFVI